MSINRVTVSGNLGKDSELRSTKTGTPVLSFSVCVNSRVKRGDEWQEKPNWVDVTMFGTRAESVSRYLKKGTHVTVDGRINQRTWDAKDGSKRSKLEVICDDIDFTSPRQEGQAYQQEDIYDEDCPF